MIRHKIGNDQFIGNPKPSTKSSYQFKNETEENFRNVARTLLSHRVGLLFYSAFIVVHMSVCRDSVFNHCVMLCCVILHGYLYSASHRRLFIGALSVTGR